MGRVLEQEKPSDPTGVTIEAWSGGWMVGALIVMACVTVVNMRRKVLLHKLILIELVIGMPVGTFFFMNGSTYHWYLSTTAIFLYISWSLHNVIAWIKNRPFLSKGASRFYIITVIAVQPFWVFEMVANYMYFGGWNLLFTHSRPFEPLFRDPWWVFTVCNLFWNIKTKYEFGYVELIRVSPRFGVLLGAMVLSICFMIIDILSVTSVIPSNGLPDGINPFWKFAYIFKCLTDTIVLDDFKTALDRLLQHKMQRIGSRIGSIFSDGVRGEFDDDPHARHERSATGPRDRVIAYRANSSMLHNSSSSKVRDWTELNDLPNIDIESALHIDDVAKDGSTGDVTHSSRSEDKR